jgi:uncharacterized membrane protein
MFIYGVSDWGNLAMLLLILGLVLFLGIHSVRVFADGVRTGFITRRGPGPWKGLYALASAVGLVLIVVGYGQARGGAPLVSLGADARYATYALTWLGFVLVTAAYWPANHFRRAIGDPMVAGVGLWALGHLLVNTTPAALVLFGAFLVWAVVDYLSLRARARTAATAPAPASALNTVLATVVGTVAWAVFAAFLHKWLIGVSPFA